MKLRTRHRTFFACLLVALISSNLLAKGKDGRTFSRHTPAGFEKQRVSIPQETREHFSLVGKKAAELPGAIDGSLGEYAARWMLISSLVNQYRQILAIEGVFAYLTDVDKFLRPADGRLVCQKKLDQDSLADFQEEVKAEVRLATQEARDAAAAFDTAYLLTMAQSSLETTDLEADLDPEMETTGEDLQEIDSKPEYSSLPTLVDWHSDTVLFGADTIAGKTLNKRVQHAVQASRFSDDLGATAERQLKDDSVRMQRLGQALAEVELFRLVFLQRAEIINRWLDIEQQREVLNGCYSRLSTKIETHRRQLKHDGISPRELKKELSSAVEAANRSGAPVFSRLVAWAEKSDIPPERVESTLSAMAAELRIRLSSKRAQWNELRRMAELEARLLGMR